MTDLLNKNRLWRGVTLVALICVLAALPVLAPAAARSDDAPALSARFGVVEAYFRPDDAVDLGVGWERIVFEWPRFQPDSPDEYDTSAIPDEWLQDAQDAGREIVGILKNVPLWASGGDLLGQPPQGLDLPIDDPENYWAQFVRQTVEYYGEEWGITHWIIFNEPDILPGEIGWYEFDGGVEDYYALLKVAYLAAHTVNPDVTIHISGMMWWGDKAAYRLPYLQRLLEVASRDPDAYEHDFFFDVVNVHTYFGTSAAWEMLEETQRILWYYGLYLKRIWIDETNASPTLDPEAPLPDPPYRVTLDQQADYIVQVAALALAADVERFAIYRLYDNHYSPGSETWGLVRGDGSRRPAFDRYAQVIRLFDPTEEASYHYSDHASLVVLQQGDRTLYVMWARDEIPVRFHIEVDPVQERDAEIARLAYDGSTEEMIGAEYFTTDAGDEFIGWWHPVDVEGAVPGDDEGNIYVEGPPVIVAIEGPPRSVWVNADGAFWFLR